MMKFHKQLNRHDPDNGVWGDCFRTALACLLDMNPEDVPHFLEGGPEPEEFMRRHREWLLEHGYSIFAIGFDAGLEDVMKTMKNVNPGLYYLISGQSVRGINHVCIGLEDKIIHDPMPDGDGIKWPCKEDGYYWVEVLVPITIHKAAA
jgi:hypothetical protein